MRCARFLQRRRKSAAARHEKADRGHLRKISHAPKNFPRGD
jgi:hypothetical protein